MLLAASCGWFCDRLRLSLSLEHSALARWQYLCSLPQCLCRKEPMADRGACTSGIGLD